MKQPDFDSISILINNSPLEDFCGLTPTEMHHLLYDSHGDKSPVRLRTDIDNSTLDGVPFFRLTEELLRIFLRDKSIKLTPLGALPRKILHELYSHRLITEDIIEAGVSKLAREIDSVAITTIHLNTLLTGVIKKAKGKLTLTKKGLRLLQPEHRRELFKETLVTFTVRFSWGYNDGYPQHPIGQLGWGFTVYLLNRFGEREQTGEFYAKKYLQAFPRFLTFFPERDFGTPIEDFTNCFRLRTFERFLEWFGLIRVGRSHGILERHSYTVSRTDLMNKVFSFD